MVTAQAKLEEVAAATGVGEMPAATGQEKAESMAAAKWWGGAEAVSSNGEGAGFLLNRLTLPSA